MAVCSCERVGTRVGRNASIRFCIVASIVASAVSFDESDGDTGNVTSVITGATTVGGFPCSDWNGFRGSMRSVDSDVALERLDDNRFGEGR